MDFVAKHGATFDLTEEDRLVFSGVRPFDGRGLMPSRGFDQVRDAWAYEFPARKTLFVRGAAALEVDPDTDALSGTVFRLPRPRIVEKIVERVVEKIVEVPVPTPGTPGPVLRQRHGPSLSNSRNGYYESVARFLAPWVFDGGARAVRIPIKRKLLWQDGIIRDSIPLNGYETRQWLDLKKIIDFCLFEDVAVVIDDHTYSPYSNPEVLAFWLALGEKLKATYGSNDLIQLEIQNETSEGGWDAGYAAGVKGIVDGLRAAQIDYPLIFGWGGWNSVSGHARALQELDQVGGAEHLDRLGKLAFSAHNYPTTTGNDQAASGKNAPQIKGGALSSGWQVMFEEFQRRALRVWITEIGMGGGAHGWLANGAGAPDFDGKAWFDEFAALVARFPDTVAGVLAWGGGSAWPVTYPFRLEWQKDDWNTTRSTEFWRSLTTFWRGAP